MGRGSKGGHTPHATQSPTHMCKGNRFGRVSGCLEIVMVEAEQLWALCLETSVFLLSHDFCVAYGTLENRIGLFSAS